MPGTRPGMTTENLTACNHLKCLSMKLAGHLGLAIGESTKTWTPGTRPGMTTENLVAQSAKILVDNAPVDRRQGDEVRDRHAFIDLMHGLPDQAEFQHGAVILDEACVGGAAGGRELGRAPGDLGNGGNCKLGEGSGLGDENVGVRWLPVKGKMHAASRRGLRPPLDQHLERGRAVAVVVADVEARAPLAGDEVDGRVADIDRGEFEMRRIEMRAAFVER